MLFLPDGPIHAPRARLQVVWQSSTIVTRLCGNTHQAKVTRYLRDVCAERRDMLGQGVRKVVRLGNFELGVAVQFIDSGSSDHLSAHVEISGTRPPIKNCPGSGTTPERALNDRCGRHAQIGHVE